MRARQIILLAAMLSAACSIEAGGPGKLRLKPADRKAIEAIVNENAEIARRAWTERDASIMIPDSSTVSLRSPEGKVLSPAELRQGLQKRMDGVARIDTMAMVVDSFLVASADSVVVYSTQRFVRLLRRADGLERQRFSVVGHQQLFVRRLGKWMPAAPEREVNPRNWWGDEAPPVN